jgi:hypothetical protein
MPVFVKPHSVFSSWPDLIHSLLRFEYNDIDSNNLLALRPNSNRGINEA